jgi:DNA adenine methylase/adenine-specific DNA-methyltransferase
LKNKLIDYQNRLKDRDVEFYCKSAFDINFKLYDITLIDPPYLNTIATYNEKNGWNADLENMLHDKIKSECNKFVYFGQTVSNGIKNELLVEFAKNYNVKILKTTTENCSSTKKKKGETVEVMIWN